MHCWARRQHTLRLGLRFAPPPSVPTGGRLPTVAPAFSTRDQPTHAPADDAALQSDDHLLVRRRCCLWHQLTAARAALVASPASSSRSADHPHPAAKPLAMSAAAWPPCLAPIGRYIARAAEIKDVEPVVAYYCMLGGWAGGWVGGWGRPWRCAPGCWRRLRGDRRSFPAGAGRQLLAAPIAILMGAHRPPPCGAAPPRSRTVSHPVLVGLGSLLSIFFHGWRAALPPRPNPLPP